MSHEAATGGRRPLRVLYVAPHATLGGAVRAMLDLVSLHDRSTIEPSLCFLQSGPLVADCRERLGIHTYLVPAPRLRRILASRRAARTIADLITAGHVDLVHSLAAAGHVYGGRAAARSRRPAVWFQHAAASWRNPVEVRAALVKSAAIIANSEYAAERQRRVNPLRAPIHVIHPGTRMTEGSFEQRRAAARAALGLRDGEFAVGIVTRLEPGKGQRVVIRAAASLLHARAHARLFVIGERPAGAGLDYVRSLTALVRELGIEGRVTMTGFRHDVPEVLAGLDVAVHAATSPEPFSVGLIEAMAARVALIAADAGGARESVTPRVDGLLTRPGDHEALATALLALCDDPAQRERLARAGEATARARFDARQMTAAVEALYRRVAVKTT